MHSIGTKIAASKDVEQQEPTLLNRSINRYNHFAERLGGILKRLKMYTTHDLAVPPTDTFPK